MLKGRSVADVDRLMLIRISFVNLILCGIPFFAMTFSLLQCSSAPKDKPQPEIPEHHETTSSPNHELQDELVSGSAHQGIQLYPPKHFLWQFKH